LDAGDTDRGITVRGGVTLSRTSGNDRGCDGREDAFFRGAALFSLRTPAALRLNGREKERKGEAGVEDKAE